ncbi:MAG: hypothetical protein RLZZ210_361, partial [Pseudomonadota bacterium]
KTMWNLSDSCKAKVIYETGTGLFYSGTFQNKPHINSKSLINCQDKDCSIRANKEDMGIHQLLVDRDAMQHRSYSDDKSKLKRKQQDSLEALKADSDELSL